MALKFHPPILNAAGPWATTLEDLQALYSSPHTGAITIRTSLLDGFAHDDNIHKYVFFSPSEASLTSSSAPKTSSLNTLGYSPIPLATYLTYLPQLTPPLANPIKPIIISTTGPSTSLSAIAAIIGANVTSNVVKALETMQIHEPENFDIRKLWGKPLEEAIANELAKHVKLEDVNKWRCRISECTKLFKAEHFWRKHVQNRHPELLDALKRDFGLPSHAELDILNRTCPPLLIELNLSCPNIAGSPPPAYNPGALSAYLSAIPRDSNLPWGIKLPPYTHAGEFRALVETLLAHNPCPIKFITSTNTLGNCLVLPEPDVSMDSSWSPKLENIGVGGLAGPSIHPLSLGNVCTLRKMLGQHESLKYIEIIGVGGVRDADGYRRMRSVGAKAVAMGTIVGIEGIGVFERVASEVEKGTGW